MDPIDLVKPEEKSIGQIVEEIEVTGQESEEKAAKWVIELEKQKEARKKKEEADFATYFDKQSKGKIKTYARQLELLLNHVLTYLVEWPPKYKFMTVSSPRGVGVMVKKPNGEYFQRGFKPVHDQKYDLNAINVLAMQVENTLADYKEPEKEFDVQTKIKQREAQEALQRADDSGDFEGQTLDEPTGGEAES